MLRYKTEYRPGLVALYDIRPGNGAVNSYNPGARTCRLLLVVHSQRGHTEHRLC